MAKGHIQKKQENIRPVHLLEQILWLGAYVLASVFVTLNILVSQYIPSQFTALAKGEMPAILETIREGRFLPQFQPLFSEVKGLMKDYDKDIFSQDRDRRNSITSLEILLEQYPESRDLLVALATLYEKEEDMARAQEYLMRARMLDPEAGKDSEK